MAAKARILLSLAVLAASLAVAALILVGPEKVQALLVRLVAAAAVVLFGLFSSLLVYGMIGEPARQVETVKQRVEAELERVRGEEST